MVTWNKTTGSSSDFPPWLWPTPYAHDASDRCQHYWKAAKPANRDNWYSRRQIIVPDRCEKVSLVDFPYDFTCTFCNMQVAKQLKHESFRLESTSFSFQTWRIHTTSHLQVFKGCWVREWWNTGMHGAALGRCCQGFRFGWLPIDSKFTGS